MSRRSNKVSDDVTQFCQVTGASAKDAKRLLDKHRRLDLAIDAYYNSSTSAAPSTTKLNQLFDVYKDPDGDDIAVEGTIKLCEDLGVDPEDVVLLAVAYELKSPRMGEWSREGWVNGWKVIGVDNIPAMKTSLLRLRDRLGSERGYFQSVYSYAFDFARPSGQRSLAMDMAQGFWGLLIPHGLAGGALAHIPSNDDEDDYMGVDDEGWKSDYLALWFEFLNERKLKAISKDVWHMFVEFVRSIDSKFVKYDAEGGAWPSTIDDFVAWARSRLV